MQSMIPTSPCCPIYDQELTQISGEFYRLDSNVKIVHSVAADHHKRIEILEGFNQDHWANIHRVFSIARGLDAKVNNLEIENSKLKASLYIIIGAFAITVLAIILKY